MPGELLANRNSWDFWKSSSNYYDKRWIRFWVNCGLQMERIWVKLMIYTLCQSCVKAKYWCFLVSFGRMSLNEDRLKQILHLWKGLGQRACCGAGSGETHLLLELACSTNSWVPAERFRGEKQRVLSLFLTTSVCSPVLGLTDPPSLKDCAICFMNTGNR